MGNLVTIVVLGKVVSLAVPDIQQVETSIKEIRSFSQRSPCVATEITNLEQSCARMTDAQKSQVALKLTNCILKQAKKPTVTCPEDRPDECLSQLSGDSWTSYSNFHIHIDSLCYYYSSLLWQERTGRLINSLSETSSDAQKMLSQNLQQTKNIVDVQNSLQSSMKDSVIVQKQMGDTIKSHHQDIIDMAEGIQGTINTLEESVNKHYKVIQGVLLSIDSGLSHLKSVQECILGQIQDGIGSVVYYLLTTLGLLFITVVSRTVRKCFAANVGLILVSVMLERVLKFVFLGAHCLKARVLVLVVVSVFNLVHLLQSKPFQQEMFNEVSRLRDSINSRMNTERIKQVCRRSQLTQRTW